jgi:hypothetical protein
MEKDMASFKVHYRLLPAGNDEYHEKAVRVGDGLDEI